MGVERSCGGLGANSVRAVPNPIGRQSRSSARPGDAAGAYLLEQSELEDAVAAGEDVQGFEQGFEQAFDGTRKLPDAREIEVDIGNGDYPN